MMVDFNMCSYRPKIWTLHTKTSIEWVTPISGHRKMLPKVNNLIFTSSGSQRFCTTSIPEEMLVVVTAGLKRALWKVVVTKNSNLEGCPVCQQVRDKAKGRTRGKMFKNCIWSTASAREVHNVAKVSPKSQMLLIRLLHLHSSARALACWAELGGNWEGRDALRLVACNAVYCHAQWKK